MAFKTDGTCSKGKMSLLRRVMTHGTLGYGLCAARQVVNVAVETGDLCSVLAPGSFYIGWFRLMAFYTISIQQFVGGVQSQDFIGRGPELGGTFSC